MTYDQTRRVIEAVAEGLRVLRTRDGIDLSEDQIRERARNITQAVMFVLIEDEEEETDGAESCRSASTC